MPSKADPKPKAPAKKAAAPKPAATKATAPKANAEPRVDGLHKPLQPSPDLAAIVGSKPLSRSDVVSKMWEHIKKNDLQNPKDKREILADDKLEKVFGKKSATMFEMNKLISRHLK